MKKEKVSEKEIRETCHNYKACKKKKCSVCKDIYEYCFVKHPPKRPLLSNDLQKTSLYKSERELDDFIFLPNMVEDISKSFNPIDAIEVFRRAYEENVYPPVSVLRWLYDGFNKWVNAGGNIPLENALGLTHIGTGKRKITQPLAKKMIKKRDEEIMFDVFFLNYHLKIPVTKAAEMVAQKWRKMKFDNTGLNLSSLDAKTIETQYHMQKRDNYFRKLLSRDGQQVIKPWTEEQKKNFRKSLEVI